MNRLKMILALIIIGICSLANTALAYEENENLQYLIGIRSMAINGSMRLSEIDQSFGDLPSDGFRQGPHHSSLYIMRSVNRYLRMGIENLVGNSGTKNSTTMNFQGIGMVIDTIFGHKYFINGGIHAGPIILNVMSNSSGLAASNGVNAGTHYKDQGLFIAPYLGVGVRLGKFELSLITKLIEVTEGEKNNNIKAFSAQYTGVSLGYRF